jgi:hypothetical protein
MKQGVRAGNVGLYMCYNFKLVSDTEKLTLSKDLVEAKKWGRKYLGDEHPR